MNKNITLSYVLTTFNKLPYLREVMKRLLENTQPDEEIVITDGASTDGTVEYLTELYNQGKIHQFISELDKGESHGFNKGLLMAKGELIKLISDDDVFCYSAIQECKRFMKVNSSFDCVTGGIASLRFDNFELSQFIIGYEYEKDFTEWINKKKNTCFFGGLALMIRKSALSKFGLFDLSYTHIDLEYCTRLTFLKAKIAYYTALNVIAIRNNESKSVSTKSDIVSNECNRVNYYYNDKIIPIYTYSTITLLEIIFSRIKNQVKQSFKRGTTVNTKTETGLYFGSELLKPTYNNIGNLFSDCEVLMREYNNSMEQRFIY